jgi:hypothetical protein
VSAPNEPHVETDEIQLSPELQTYVKHSLLPAADSLSFTLASMSMSTLFFWLRLGSIHEKYKSAMTITGLVTFIAAYHYVRIFNSWVDSYEFPAASDGLVRDPVITGRPFNDAYRYMDWLLTVPLLLIEIVFVRCPFALPFTFPLGFMFGIVCSGDEAFGWRHRQVGHSTRRGFRPHDHPRLPG